MRAESRFAKVIRSLKLDKKSKPDEPVVASDDEALKAKRPDDDVFVKPKKDDERSR